VLGLISPTAFRMAKDRVLEECGSNKLSTFRVVGEVFTGMSSGRPKIMGCYKGKQAGVAMSGYLPQFFLAVGF
jgi:hypothetical protein